MKIHYEHTGSTIVRSRESFGDNRWNAEYYKAQEAKRLGQPVAVAIHTDGYHLVTLTTQKTLMADGDGEAMQ